MLDHLPEKFASVDIVSTPVITTHALAKTYRNGREVLKGINLTIRQGERVALIGSNGSGKSTLLRCLIGLNEVSSGKVTTLGETFTAAPTKAQRVALRRQTGFVFQKHCLVRRRSVLSNVVHGMLSEAGSWRGFAQCLAPESWRSAALDALAEVNLADRANARADTLSGGQQQRVAVARALVRRPRLLIADEPAASLDPVSGHEVMAIFARLCADHGITMLFTSHDMNHVLEYADRIVALKEGRILFDKPSATTTDADLKETFRVENR
ncbi:phosphonate transport system ATP-binding protein [Sulfitobacter undariae]|uniref:Phosphonate transport system ATP-binding protein n=1 Tax=Sulfitobacter undariae TaxID=1563671 RepID=A0A7W6H2L5_9RHOB|nr:phosphonate ABC transporter ATP-binding protein [Sulfitobacter undariae]MBB3995943.1 phosphonate transport system ATP-binding protein [Sulfitobacter undariae]